MNDRYIYGKLNKEVEKVEYTGLPGEDGVSIVVDNDENTIKAEVDFNRFNYTSGESTNATLTIDNEERKISVDVEDMRTIVDDEISSTSENPVQNKVIYGALQEKQDTLTFDQVPTEGSSNPVTSGGIYSALSGYEPKIDSNNKLSADLVDDTNTINKFVTESEKTSWSGKQDALSQTQLDAVNSGIDSQKVEQIGTNEGNISTIQGLIPNDATTENQLASKDFVNSSISTNTAYFRGTYNIVTDLGLTTSATTSQVATALATKMASLSITPTNNDYCFVSYPNAIDPTQFDKYDRYKYNGELLSWEYEYTLNNSSFTALQWAAINSEITNGLVVDLQDLLAGNKTKTINNASIIGTGNINTDDFYLCTYGTTTYAQISTAITNGKIPYLINGTPERVFFLQVESSSQYIFMNISFASSNYSINKISVTTSNTWSSTNITVQRTSDLVTSLSSSSTDTQYPSAKCVYDNLALKQDTLVSGTNIKTINNTSILGSGDIDTKELFECIYGTTTYAQITSALSSGKLPVCFYDNKQYVYVGLSNTNRYKFSSQLFDTQRYISVNDADSWGGGNNNFEITSNKVTSLSSSSTDTQYPSAKCVYDAIANAPTYKAFPSSWSSYTTIDSQNTIEDFCAVIDSDTSVKVGNAYLGELDFDSTPFQGNAEALIEIVNESNSHKTIHIVLTSGTDYPYHWEYTYWTIGGLVHTSGWIGAQVEPKVVNNVSPTWVSDATYANYGYKGTITISGVTSSMRPEVTFGLAESISGNYAPICEAISGGVVIYGKVNTAITIPTIVVYER